MRIPGRPTVVNNSLISHRGHLRVAFFVGRSPLFGLGLVGARDLTMVEDNSFHPDPKQLTAFGLGRLSDGDSTLIEQHVARCDTCRFVLETVNDDDSVVHLLRAAGASLPESPYFQASVGTIPPRFQ